MIISDLTAYELAIEASQRLTNAGIKALIQRLQSDLERSPRATTKDDAQATD